MKLKSLLLLFSLISISVSSCKSDGSSAGETPYTMESISDALESKTEEKEEEVKAQKLIKEGNIQFKTKDIEATRNAINQSVKKYKGYISNDNAFSSETRITHSVEVRIPSIHFDKFLAEVSLSAEEIEEKNIDIRDVTEEYLDIEARIKTKKELEKRYISLLAQARTINEILSIEKQLLKIREEIESIEGRLNYLKNKVTYSTLTIRYYKEISKGNQYFIKIVSSLRNGWYLFISFLLFLINIWPFLIAGAIILIIATRKKRSK